MPGKMVMLCTSDEPSRAYPPFMIALAALASDVSDVMLFFTMGGLNIVKKAGAEKIVLPRAPMTLPEFLKKAQEMGVRMVACSAALPIAGIPEGDVLEGVTIAGVATFVAEAEEASTVLSF
jgi:predicted peroxiredoxin